jgi:hypothetical protein
MSSREYQSWAAFFHVEAQLEAEARQKALQAPKKVAGLGGSQVVRYDLLAGGKRIE